MTREDPAEAGIFARAACDAESYELLEGDLDGGLLILADHASNLIPSEYRGLGLSSSARERHIAGDIGVGPLARNLAERLRAPAILTTFSRLLIDPNRGEDDPTLIMRLSDGTIVPGNAIVDAAERERRLKRFYRPYHSAIKRLIDAMLATGWPPALLSIHSYTPVWKGETRPWHAGLLWDRDPRFSIALLEALRAEHGLRIGDNEPYSGALKHDTMYRHGSGRGLAHALLEIRNDLIDKPAGVLEWADRLEPLLKQILADPTLHQTRRYGPASDGHGEGDDEGDNDAANGRRHAHGA